jgi:hypothetical protein
LKPPAFCRLKFSTRTSAASLCLILLSAAPCLNAQPKAPPQTQPAAPFFDATNLRDTADLSSADWLVHAGDDPAYARPDFDDSHWTPFDPRTSLKTIFPNHPEIVWYRLRIKVPPGETGLSLEAFQVSSAFEIYANGQRILQSGQVSPFKGYTTDARVQVRIPDAQVATGTVLLAQRVHLSTLEWDWPYPGGSSPRLGQENALREHIWLKTIGLNLFNWMNQFAGLGLGFVALALFASQRRHPEYLWIFLAAFFSTLREPLYIYELFHNVPYTLQAVNESFSIANTIFLILMYFAFLRIPFGRGMQAFTAAVVLSYAFAAIGIANGTLGLVGAYLAILPLVLLLTGVIPVLLVIHFRRGNREAGILLIPVILYSLDQYSEIALGLLGRVPALAPAVNRASNVLQSLYAGPFLLQLSTIGDLLFVLTLAIIIVLRSARISRQQAELESEIAAAREVQQVLVPETISALPGFTLTSAYRPAQEVGGDFFQIIPLDSGSTLVVLGDVSGKGLKAAMAVSLIVGAIRTVAETTSSPAEILACLNRRLYGRLNGGFSTAIAMRLDADGACTIASAGHPEPFLNDREIEMPGALPLGVEPAVSYAEHSFMLGATDRLALYTDGLLEARSISGELFSFDRLKTLFAAKPSAAQATEAAVDFGQEDDITVLTLTRLAIGEESTAIYTAPTFAPA